jgi:hypothetical protein
LLDKQSEPEEATNENKIESDTPERPPGKPGRPHLEEDVWAWKQVNELNRPREKVQEEWLNKPGVNGRHLVEPKRQFKRIIKYHWMTKS